MCTPGAAAACARTAGADALWIFWLAGVRARQERVPFATCEDESEVSATVLPLVGQHVRMQATASGMQLDVAAAQQAQQSSNGSASVPAAPAGGAAPKAATTERVRSLQLLPLRDATAATSGAKASACGELLRLAGDASVVPGKRPAGDGPSANGATPQATAPPPFAAPDGVVLPFGCMEAALTAAGQAGALSSLQEQLRVVLGSMQQGAASGNLAALDALCSDVQELITNLRIPQNVSAPLLPRVCLCRGHGLSTRHPLSLQLLQQMSGVFKPGATVIVRSSANVEDLAGMSGEQHAWRATVCCDLARRQRGACFSCRRRWALRFDRQRREQRPRSAAVRHLRRLGQPLQPSRGAEPPRRSRAPGGGLHGGVGAAAVGAGRLLCVAHRAPANARSGGAVRRAGPRHGRDPRCRWGWVCLCRPGLCCSLP